MIIFLIKKKIIYCHEKSKNAKDLSNVHEFAEAFIILTIISPVLMTD